jgi:hypothetical protein
VGTHNTLEIMSHFSPNWAIHARLDMILDEKVKEQLLQGTSCRNPLIIPVNFRTRGKYMLERLHQVVSTH